MSATPLHTTSIRTTLAAAAVAGSISIGLLSSVVLLFQHDGQPFEHLIAAERACAKQSFGVDREVCLRSFADASRVIVVASR